MKKLFILLFLLTSMISYSQGIQSEKYLLSENMCDQICKSIFEGNKDKSYEIIDSLCNVKIIECIKEYVVEISKKRFTYPYRMVFEKYKRFPSETESLYAEKYFNITEENIHSGISMGYRYYVYDSIMFKVITSKYGDSIFTKIKKSSDSLIKKGKGYKYPEVLGKKKRNLVFKDIFNGFDVNKIDCEIYDYVMIIDSLGVCTDIEIIKLGENGLPVKSTCNELEKQFSSRREKLLKLKWRPAEFEGVPIKSEISNSFYEFEN